MVVEGQAHRQGYPVLMGGGIPLLYAPPHIPRRVGIPALEIRSGTLSTVTKQGITTMPTAPPSRCTEPHCREYAIYKGKCEEHYIPWERKSKRNTLFSAADLAKWAKQILKRDRTCQHCGKKPATEADHIIPVSRGGAGLDLSNGQGLCHRCHWIKTRREIAQNNRDRNKPRQVGS